MLSRLFHFLTLKNQDFRSGFGWFFFVFPSNVMGHQGGPSGPGVDLCITMVGSLDSIQAPASSDQLGTLGFFVRGNSRD